jgi:hypothetical protein
LTARHGLFHCLDVGAELKKQLRDARDDARLVVPDESNGRKRIGHGRSVENALCLATHLHDGRGVATMPR